MPILFPLAQFAYTPRCAGCGCVLGNKRTVEEDGRVYCWDCYKYGPHDD